MTFLRMRRAARRHCSEKSVRLAQKMLVGPCIPVEGQLEKAEVGPLSGPTWRLAHLLDTELQQASSSPEPDGNLVEQNETKAWEI